MRLAFSCGMTVDVTSDAGNMGKAAGQRIARPGLRGHWLSTAGVEAARDRLDSFVEEARHRALNLLAARAET